MNTLLRITGARKLVSFYSYVYFDLPQLTRLSGVGLVLLVGAIHAYELPHHFVLAPYIGVSFALLVAGALLSAYGIVRGARWGWWLGSLISAIALVGYLASRLSGLPGFAQAMGEWDTPLGSVAAIVESLYLGLHFSILTGMNVAAPDKRNWYD